MIGGPALLASEAAPSACGAWTSVELSARAAGGLTASSIARAIPGT